MVITFLSKPPFNTWFLSLPKELPERLTDKLTELGWKKDSLSGIPGSETTIWNKPGSGLFGGWSTDELVWKNEANSLLKAERFKIKDKKLSFADLI